MSKKKILIAVVAIAVIIIAASGLGLGGFSTQPIHGYSGLEARGNDIDSSYTDREVVGITDLTLEPGEPRIVGTTGLRASISQPQAKANMEVLEPVSRFYQRGDDNVTETVQKVIYHMQVSVDIVTYGSMEQLAEVSGVTFWWQLRQNPFSTFQNPDDTRAYIINVRTEEYERSEPGFADIATTPGAEGYDVALDPLETVTVPDWILQSEYASSNLQYFGNVRFPVTVDRAKPGYHYEWLIGNVRDEAAALLKFEVDVVVFGEWVQVRPWEDTGSSGDDDTTIPELILEFLATAGWLLFGVIATVAIVWKAPGKWKALVVVPWVIIAWQLGWLDPVLARLGV